MLAMIAPVFLTLAIFLGVLALASVWWPKSGLVARWRLQREEAAGVHREDALKHLCKAEAGGRRPTIESVAGALPLKPDEAGELLHDMEQRGLVSFASGELCLTPQGRTQGAQVIRAHRLWETHLAENTGVHETEWHAQAEHQEHKMSLAETDALSAQLGHPTHDPHGDPIPSSAGDLAGDVGQSLNTLKPDELARIIHIEDEPASLYAQLAALNLRTGMTVQMKEVNASSVRFTADGAVNELAPILAHQIEVLPVSKDDAELNAKTLAEFKPVERATVLELARGCRGQERRRLLDLGFVPGTVIEVEMISPTGEPTAYVVRGTVIALHREQARLVLVKPAEVQKS